MTESPRSVAADDPEWCAGCGQKHSKCECPPTTDHVICPDCDRPDPWDELNHCKTCGRDR